MFGEYVKGHRIFETFTVSCLGFAVMELSQDVRFRSVLNAEPVRQ